MADAVVLYEVSDAVAVVTLNRPDRMNGWIPELEYAYFDTLARAGDDPAVRAIVVTGAGRAFCAGGDIGFMDGMDGMAPPRKQPMTYPTTVPKLIVAAINGACAGAGFGAALMCDVRFARHGAKLTTSFARLGLAAEIGTSWLLPHLVGTSRALDLLLSGRVITAEEAFDLGVINRVVPPDELLPQAMAYAREVATNCSPASVATIKAQVYRDATRDLDSAYDDAERLMHTSLRGPDLAEGLASYLEKRAPQFPPLGQGTLFG